MNANLGTFPVGITVRDNGSICHDIGNTDPSFGRVRAILNQAARVNVLAYEISAVGNVGR
jgi:hypothetical protein